MLVPSVSIKDHSMQAYCVRDLIVLATYSSKPNTLVIPLWERTTAHWEWRDGKSSVYTSCESIIDEQRREVQYYALG